MDEEPVKKPPVIKPPPKMQTPAYPPSRPPATPVPFLTSCGGIVLLSVLGAVLLAFLLFGACLLMLANGISQGK